MMISGPYWLGAKNYLQICNLDRTVDSWFGPFPYNTSYRVIDDRLFIRVRAYRWPNENPYIHGDN